MLKQKAVSVIRSICLLFSVLIIFLPSAAQADSNVFQQLQTPFYDPNSSAACTSELSVPDGSSNKDIVVKFLIAHVGSPVAVAALAGNFELESGFSSTADNGQGYYGLAQWGGSRLTNLRNYADSVGGQASDLGVQLNFMLQELQKSYGSTLSKITTSDAVIPPYPNGAASPSPNDAVYNVVLGYEGAVDKNQKFGVQAYDYRLRYANDILSQYGSTTSIVNSSSAATSSPCGSQTGASGTGACVSPFPGGWVPNRLDMGYDGTFSGQIVAPCAGTVTYSSTSFSNWGGWIELTLDQQPAGLPTSTLYFAEGVAPLVSSGKHVSAGDPIASPAVSPYGNAYGTTPNGVGQIEWGVAQNGSVGSPTNTYVYGQCGSSSATQSVLDFAQWAESLGLAGPATTNNAGCP